MISVNPQVGLSIDLASATIAVMALLISFWVSRRQSVLALRTLRLQRDGAIIEWSRRAMDLLCSAEMILREDYLPTVTFGEYEKARLWIMRDISSCIDQGRLFFPNLDHEKEGVHREAAYKGFRHPILDCLVFTYRLLRNDVSCERPATFEGLRRKVTEFRRSFVSGVQSELDPRGLGKFLQDET